MHSNISIIEKAAFIGHLGDLQESSLGTELGALAAEWGHTLGIEKKAYEQRNFSSAGPRRFDNRGGSSRPPQSNREDSGSPAMRDMVMVGGIGGAIGLALASRKVNALKGETAKRLMSETTNLRSLGNKAGTVYNDAGAARTKKFEDMFASIEDPAKRKYVHDTTKNITKLINNLGHNTEYFKRHDVHAQLKQLINDAQAQKEIPMEVAEHLHKELNSSIRITPRSTGNFEGSLGVTPSSTRTLGSSLLGALDTMTGG